MMDVTVLAASAVALLSPYLLEGLKGFAQKIGEKACEGVGKLLSLMRSKMLGRAEEALADLETAPADEDNQADFRKQLKKVLEADPAFAGELGALVDDIQAKGGAPVTQILNVTGDHNKSAQITGSGNTVTM